MDLKKIAYIIIFQFILSSINCQDNNMKLKYDYYNAFLGFSYQYEAEFSSDIITISFIDADGNIEKIQNTSNFLILQVYDYFKKLEVLKPDIEIDDYENKFELDLDGKHFIFLSLDDSFSNIYPHCYEYDLLINLHNQIMEIIESDKKNKISF